MTAVLVDANVLLDVMTEDARWLAWSSEAIERAADRHRVVINPVMPRSRNSTLLFRKRCWTAKESHTKPPFWRGNVS